MSIRLTSFIIVPVVAVAGALALFGVGRETSATAAAPGAPALPQLPPVDDAPAIPNGAALPANHPPIGGGGAPHGSVVPSADEAPAIAWTMPSGWTTAPNPNAMRLATYRIPSGVEVSVARAGGATEANIQRWVGQFDDVGKEIRTESTIRGLHVVSVEIAGTYVGGGMAMGAPNESKPGWAMLGAIVETKGSPYFFKLVGPADAVHGARAAFDAMIASVTPR